MQNPPTRWSWYPCTYACVYIHLTIMRNLSRVQKSVRSLDMYELTRFNECRSQELVLPENYSELRDRTCTIQNVAVDRSCFQRLPCETIFGVSRTLRIEQCTLGLLRPMSTLRASSDSYDKNKL